MNLSSLSDADLDKIFAAVEGVDTKEAADVYDVIMAETDLRNAGKGADIKTGFRVEFYKGYDNKWADGKDSYFGRYTKVGQFFPTPDAAKAEIEKINKNIKARLYEGWKTQIKPENVRFVQVTTIRKAA